MKSATIPSGHIPPFTMMEINAILAVAAAQSGDLDVLVEQAKIVGDWFDESVALQIRNRLINLRDNGLITLSKAGIFTVTPKGVEQVRLFLSAAENTALWASKLLPKMLVENRKTA